MTTFCHLILNYKVWFRFQCYIQFPFHSGIGQEYWRSWMRHSRYCMCSHNCKRWLTYISVKQWWYNLAVVEGRGLAKGEVGVASIDLKEPVLLLSQVYQIFMIFTCEGMTFSEQILLQGSLVPRLPNLFQHMRVTLKNWDRPGAETRPAARHATPR